MNSYQSFTDFELAGLLKSGDYSAFNEIYNRYSIFLYRHALHTLVDDDDAQDVVQDLFITLWTKKDNLEFQVNLKGYLYIMVRHKVLNVIRKRKTNSNFIEMLATFMDIHQDTVLEKIQEKELGEAIDLEIKNLPAKMRVVFEMSRKDHLSHHEIGIELGISPRTVKKQISNAIKILRLKLYIFTCISLLLLETLF